jgi:formylglycine-generating enzyme required for sulfatase activity
MSDEGLQPVLDDADFTRAVRSLTEGQKLFGRYTLVRMIGRGGMGLVWQAYDEDLGETIALKFLPDNVHVDAASLEELKRETRQSRKLAHPNIVKVYDFSNDGIAAAISMEFVDGETLAVLRTQQTDFCFEANEIEEWTRQMLNALIYAHDEARIVHRDLKPSNIMVDGGGKIKITDFGIASSISESVSRVTQQRISSGTLVYMSPQQALGTPPSVLDDIYAFGATIFELLTGKPPFYRGDILTQLWEATPPSMTQRRAELGIGGEPIPDGWERTVAACLAKDPAQRPQTMFEVAQWFGFAPAETQIVPEENATAEESSPSRHSRRKWLVGMAFAAVLSMGASLGYYNGIVVPAEKARQAQIASEQAAARVAVLKQEQEKQEAETRAAAAAQAKIDADKLALEKARKDAVDQAAAAAKAAEQAKELAAEVENQKADEAARLAAAQAAKIEQDKIDAAKALKDKQDQEALAAAAAKAAALSVAVVPTDVPVTNSQGIKFVPAGTPGVLFSVWDVRVSDYSEFVHETGQNWFKPDFAQTDNDPVVKVSWDDAEAYCAWLTKNEKDAGKLASSREYRLPTDAEWSAAIGLKETEGTPAEKSNRNLKIFPWGTQKTPPSGAGNYAGEEQEKTTGLAPDFLIGYKDDFIFTSPVGSFSANAFGLYDMGGNVWQWCQDKNDPHAEARVARGGAWSDSVTANMASSQRLAADANTRAQTIGFRVVQAVDPHAPSRDTPGPAPAPTGSTDSAPQKTVPIDLQSLTFNYLESPDGMKPCRKGYQAGSNPAQDTDDPNDLIQRRSVYFDEKNGSTLHFKVQSTEPITKLIYSGFGFCDLVIEARDTSGAIVASAGPLNYGSVNKAIDLTLPALSGFDLFIRNTNSPWILINNLRFEGAAPTGVPPPSTQPLN